MFPNAALRNPFPALASAGTFSHVSSLALGSICAVDYDNRFSWSLCVNPKSTFAETPDSWPSPHKSDESVEQNKRLCITVFMSVPSAASRLDQILRSSHAAVETIFKCFARDHNSAFTRFIAHWDWLGVSSTEPSGFLGNSNNYSSLVSVRHKPNYEVRLCETAHPPARKPQGKVPVQKKENIFAGLACGQQTITECWHSPEKSTKAYFSLSFNKQ